MFHIPDPDLQIDFAAHLREIRRQYLQDALNETVRGLAIPEIDSELATHVPSHSLSALAGHGLRGELMFPVPIVLAANPRLLGYYRLLYGYSQKEFYTASTGAGRFKGMEERGALAVRNIGELTAFCSALCKAGALLLAGIGAPKLNAGLLDQLTLLTLGPQLRGGANVKRGTAGIRTVFNVIQEIVQSSISGVSETKIEIINAAGRVILILFTADPDIVIVQQMRAGAYQQIVAIEVKAGHDFSNIHNRIGEAEKSHQKARASGFVECWTVVNVDKIDIATAHRESPSTNRFYRISDLVAASGPDYQDFRDRIISLTGIKDVSRRRSQAKVKISRA
ncbi:MAG TPA: XcyI family restriction endonuclease [Acidobacteriaceae bacterium]